MRIRALHKRSLPDGAAIGAEVVWEQARRPTVALSYRTTAPFSADLEARPEAFAIAALWPAWEAGERRIEIEGTLCPRIRDGLLVVQRVLAGWYGIGRPPIELEPTGGWAAAEPAVRPRAGMFLSGGLDSLALLREMTLEVAPPHSAAVRDAIFVYGLDLGTPHMPAREAFFEGARAGLETLCAGVGVSLVPVWTNVRVLEVRGRSWPDAWFGMATASVAHALSSRLTEVLLAASLDVDGLAPVGSHPMLDPYFSSMALTIRHEGLHRTRLEKAKIVSDWPEALGVLRVCYQDVGNAEWPNCGRCRKCVRAMLALLALGRLGDARTFPVRDLRESDLEVCTVDRLMVPFYESLVEPLRTVGRPDLARALRRRLRGYRFSRRRRRGE